MSGAVGQARQLQRFGELPVCGRGSRFEFPFLSLVASSGSGTKMYMLQQVISIKNFGEID
jgi:hypothetical protein